MILIILPNNLVRMNYVRLLEYRNMSLNRLHDHGVLV